MADAPALGAGARKGVEVQILSPTPPPLSLLPTCGEVAPKAPEGPADGDILENVLVETLGFVAIVVVLLAFLVAVLIVWDQLVGVAFARVVAGAARVVGQSKGHWYFWALLILAALTVLAALAVAILIS